MDCSPPGSLSVGFPRQEYWSGLLFSSPGDLPEPGIEHEFPALQAGALPLSCEGYPVISLKEGLISLAIQPPSPRPATS